MYEVLPIAEPDKWKLRNVASRRDVVSGISRDACIKLKRQLERNLQTRIESMNAQKENGHKSHIS